MEDRSNKKIEKINKNLLILDWKKAKKMVENTFMLKDRSCDNCFVQGVGVYLVGRWVRGGHGGAARIMRIRPFLASRFTNDPFFI